LRRIETAAQRDRAGILEAQCPSVIAPYLIHMRQDLAIFEFALSEAECAAVTALFDA
jgi:hypothetical protein